MSSCRRAVAVNIPVNGHITLTVSISRFSHLTVAWLLSSINGLSHLGNTLWHCTSLCHLQYRNTLRWRRLIRTQVYLGGPSTTDTLPGRRGCNNLALRRSYLSTSILRRRSSVFSLLSHRHCKLWVVKWKTGNDWLLFLRSFPSGNLRL